MLVVKWNDFPSTDQEEADDLSQAQMVDQIVGVESLDSKYQ